MVLDFGKQTKAEVDECRWKSSDKPQRADPRPDIQGVDNGTKLEPSEGCVFQSLELGQKRRKGHVAWRRGGVTVGIRMCVSVAGLDTNRVLLL